MGGSTSRGSKHPGSGWYQERNLTMCPKCKNYTWYRNDSGEKKCTSCGFYVSSKGDGDNGNCFITTATCRRLGKGDSCEELTRFRLVRDEWMAKTEIGQARIKQYEDVAPVIVSAIESLDDPSAVYARIWEKYLCEALRYIEVGDYRVAESIYIRMVEDLLREFVTVSPQLPVVS